VVETEDLLRAFFSSRTRVKLLRLFSQKDGQQFYLREVSKVVQESLTPVRRELLNLTNIGFLTQSHVANLVYFKANKEFVFFDEIKRMMKKTECRT